MDETTFFTPENEPYLGRYSVRLYDEALASAYATCRTIAPLTQQGDLTPLEKAVIELVPTSISIAASIRELIRQSFIPAAKILLRPLLERTAVVDFIVNQPDGLGSWLAGKRPGLVQLMAGMRGVPPGDYEIVKGLVDDFNSVVHADPTASRKFLSSDPSGNQTYSPGRTMGLEGLVDEISLAGLMALTFLESNAKRAFRHRLVAFASELPNDVD